MERSNILVAVSGGADSMYLLHLTRNCTNVHVAHVNYNYREDSWQDELLVKTYCAEHAIPFHSISVKWDGSSNFESWARDVRYSFFKELKEKYGLNHIYTAHHAGDQTETVLMRLERGTGFSGLGGIRPVNGDVVRPLIGITKDVIYSECERLGIPYREDSTNTDVRFTRNWYRHNLNTPDVSAICNEIASHVHHVETKLAEIFASYYDGLIYGDSSILIIDKRVEPDEFAFIYLSSVLKDVILLNEKIFTNIFSEDPSLRCFNIRKDIVCNKRKKRVIEIKFNQT